jgi:hypothetical protein
MRKTLSFVQTPSDRRKFRQDGSNATASALAKDLFSPHDDGPVERSPALPGTENAVLALLGMGC